MATLSGVRTAQWTLGALVAATIAGGFSGAAGAQVDPNEVADVASVNETGSAQFEQPAEALASAQRDTPNPRSAVIISDSAMAGIRWNGALDGFRGFEADDRLESCRRLVAASCNGREGYRPYTALTEIQLLDPAQPTDVLVIAVGYNDWHVGFGWQSRAVLDAARAKGFTYVAWVTYRELVGYELPSDSDIDVSNYAYMNAELRNIVASGAYPELHLWDLNAYTLGVSGWFTSDGVHELWRGSWGVADWISRHMAAIDGRPCPMPWTPTFPQDQTCPNPDPLPAFRGYPDLSGLYGL